VTNTANAQGMPAPGEILARADERRLVMGLPYAGAVTPAEAWDLQEAGAAKIVDVRTVPEWRDVGHVPEAPLIEWPRGAEPPLLDAFMRKLKEQFEDDDKLLFLCRTGVRSHYAAELATRWGFKSAYNILEGFEGASPDKGWRAAGLPWKQG
jgi:rhodanese-related sulfurtransferase